MRVAVAASDDVLSPFIQACETKNLKLVAVAVSSLQKLISRAAISMVRSMIAMPRSSSSSSSPLLILIYRCTSRMESPMS